MMIIMKHYYWSRDVSESVEERPGFFHSFAQQGSLFHRLGWSITYSTQFKTLLVRNKTAKTPTHSSTPNPRFPAHAWTLERVWNRETASCAQLQPTVWNARSLIIRHSSRLYWLYWSVTWCSSWGGRNNNRPFAERACYTRRPERRPEPCDPFAQEKGSPAHQFPWFPVPQGAFQRYLVVWSSNFELVL